MSGFYGSEGDPLIVDAETDLLTAEASSVDGFPKLQQPSEPEPNPIGRTWSFSWSTGRFRTAGAAPAEVADRRALGVWVETALRVGRYAYVIFGDNFGIEDVNKPIGEIVTTAHLSDLSVRIKDAVLVHDRIQGVENIILEVSGDAIVLRNLEVVYDETNRFSVTDVRIS